ncbi:DUF2520 domain-containing protein [bacterium]|nr:DUF2520 domain-containing protein [bacterium]
MIYKVGIIGQGRFGSLLFKELSSNYSVKTKSRNESIEKLSGCNILLIAVRSSDLQGVIEEILTLKDHPHTVIHFSGSDDASVLAHLKGSTGAMHFPVSVVFSGSVSLSDKIALFQGDEEAEHGIQEIFSHLNIRIVKKNDLNRVLYHYACTLSANIPFLFFKRSKEILKELDLPPDIALQLFESGYRNFTTSSDSEIAGPIVRAEKAVLDLHLEQLSDPAEKKLYRAMIEYFSEIKDGK